MATPAYEVNFDGLVGPTHNYAGLSFGNIASQKHRLTVSNPREAALQGLAKMKYLADLGLKQGVLPPQERPDLQTLRRLGFSGSDSQIIEKSYREAPRLLAAVYSSSSMWAANAATVSPSADTADGKVHFMPANLVTQFHRSLEPPATSAILKIIFPDPSVFVHHEPLPAAPYFADEGAANHTRLCENYGAKGMEIFVYGRSDESALSAVFPARQTLEASRAIARLHGLDLHAALFVRQSPEAIDAGAFHNDVVALGNERVLLHHERAYADGAAMAAELKKKSEGLQLLEVPEHRIAITDAVSTYLFNSQLVTLPDGTMSLIAPIECQENSSVSQYIDELITSPNPIASVHYLDVRQSMKNGGGPACLRLRVVLTEDELSRVHPGVMLTQRLYQELVNWVHMHYREQIKPEDLADPRLVEESRAALDKMTKILEIGSIYPFQK